MNTTIRTSSGKFFTRTTDSGWKQIPEASEYLQVPTTERRDAINARILAASEADDAARLEAGRSILTLEIGPAQNSAIAEFGDEWAAMVAYDDLCQAGAEAEGMYAARD